MTAGWSTATRTAEVRVPSARTELRFDDAEPTEDSADGVGDDAVDDVADDAGEDWAEDRSDDRLWERPPARYRAGRGGFDAEAAALTARARYAFRQRVVLAMLVLAVATGVAAACRAARALVGARGGRRRARRLPGVPPPPGADGGSHPGPSGGADGRHPPSVRRGRPRAGRLGRTRPGRHPSGGFRGEATRPTTTWRPTPESRRPTADAPRTRTSTARGPRSSRRSDPPSRACVRRRRRRSRRAPPSSRTRRRSWTSTTAPRPATAVRSASRRLLGFRRVPERGTGAVAQLVARLVRIE